MFDNLAALALAMGFSGIGLEFLERCQGNVGAFTRWAVQHGLDASVGVAAKAEFQEFMRQGSLMFAPARPEPF